MPDDFLSFSYRLDSVEEDASENVMSEVESLLGDKLPLLQVWGEIVCRDSGSAHSHTSRQPHQLQLISQLIFCEDQFNAQQNQPM